MERHHAIRRLPVVVLVLLLLVGAHAVPGAAAGTRLTQLVPGASRVLSRELAARGHLARAPMVGAASCEPNDGTGVMLWGTLVWVDDGTAIQGTFVNFSNCPQVVGLASYQIHGVLLGLQYLQDSATTTLQPAFTEGAVQSLTVRVPTTCRYQVDAFYGPLIDAQGTFPNYGPRVLRAMLGGDTTCPAPSVTATSESSSSDTPTATHTATATDTATQRTSGRTPPSATPTDTATQTPTASPTHTTAAGASAAGASAATNLSAPLNRTAPGQAPTATATMGQGAPQSSHGNKAHTPGLPGAGITLRPTVASSGTTITVLGHGFGEREQVTLTLNATTVTSRPGVITTSRDGAFSATFVASGDLLTDQNTVAATGNTSGETAAATLTGQHLPATHQYVFVGGRETTLVHAIVALLNPTGRSAGARLTFYAGRAVLVRQVTIPSQTQSTLAVARLVGTIGSFALTITTERHVTAQLDIAGPGGAATALQPVRLGTMWYWVDGAVAQPSQETFALFNPQTTGIAHVQVRQILASGPLPRQVTASRPAPRPLVIAVRPRSSVTVNLERAHFNRELALAVTSDRPIAVERTLTSSAGMVASAGVHPAAAWLFAEGDATHGVQTHLVILNPGRHAAHVAAVFHGPDGKVLARRHLVVVAGGAGTLDTNRFLAGHRFSSFVTSDVPVVAERSEFLGTARRRSVGWDAVGLNGPALQWTFPVVQLKRGRGEALVLYNPFQTAVVVDVVVYQLKGAALRTRVSVASQAQYSLNVTRVLRRLSRDHGVVLRSRSGLGFVVEQIISTSDHTVLRGTVGLAQ